MGSPVPLQGRKGLLQGTGRSTPVTCGVSPRLRPGRVCCSVVVTSRSGSKVVPGALRFLIWHSGVTRDDVRPLSDPPLPWLHAVPGTPPVRVRAESETPSERCETIHDHPRVLVPPSR